MARKEVVQQTKSAVSTAAFHVSELKHKPVVKAFHKAYLQSESHTSKASVLFATTSVDKTKKGTSLAFKDNLHSGFHIIRVVCIMSFMYISCLLESVG